jgi:diaminopimelate epimerase
MSSSINLYKYSATGNTFVILDHRVNKLFNNKKDEYEVLRKICSKKEGLGTDGIILLEESEELDFSMRYINADGKEVEMCGNGLRAISHFAHFEAGFGNQKHFRVKTYRGAYLAWIEKNDFVKIQMTELYDMGVKDLSSFDYFRFGYYLNTGVPHCVFEVNDLDGFDVQGWGEKIRYSSIFPEGCNANFYQIKCDGTIALRTYERGVEEETLSCGTGATAAAIALSKRFGWKNKVDVCMKGGVLKVFFDKNFKEVFLCGKVEKILSCSYERK